MPKQHYRIIKKGQEARESLKNGVDKVVDVVKTTLGPYGKNNIFEERGRTPIITNDGVTLARQILLEDEIEELGASTATETALKTNEMVGDGTSTSLVLMQSILNEAFKRLDTGKSLLQGEINAMGVKREIDESLKNVLSKLNNKAKKIESQEDIRKVAFASVEDEFWADKIAEMMHELGKDGFVAVDDTYFYESDIEIIKGMRFPGKPGHNWMWTNPERRESSKENVNIMVTNNEVESAVQAEAIVKPLFKRGEKKMVIMAPKFSADVLKSLVATRLQGKFDVLAVKIPALTTDQIEDICLYTGATFVNAKAGMSLQNTTPSEMGWARKVVVRDKEVVIIDGKGSKKEVNKKIKELKERIKNEEVKRDKEKLKRRIASLSSGVGIIKVGSSSDSEKYYIKHKLDDAVNAVKSAMEEGVVKGGGLALKEISSKLDKKDILKSPLISPYETIQENAGGNLKISDNILDPVKVVKIALKNACSVAGTLATTESAMAWKESSLENELTNYINGKENPKPRNA